MVCFVLSVFSIGLRASVCLWPCGCDTAQLDAICVLQHSALVLFNLSANVGMFLCTMFGVQLCDGMQHYGVLLKPTSWHLLPQGRKH